MVLSQNATCYYRIFNTLQVLQSPPTRGRGLKRATFCQKYLHRASPPPRGRGLKQSDEHVFVMHLSRPPRGGVD